MIISLDRDNFPVAVEKKWTEQQLNTDVVLGIMLYARKYYCLCAGSVAVVLTKLSLLGIYMHLAAYKYPRYS